MKIVLQKQGLMCRLVGDKLMKVVKTIIFVLLSLLCTINIFLFEIKNWPAGSSISGIILGFAIPKLNSSIQDLFDNTTWKSSQRKLERGGLIKKDTIIRISFAYLYRIKIGNKYFLIKNGRGTGKYQPVGGVYKLKGNEKIELKNLFHVKDDNKVTIDKSSRDDYRLLMENRYLRKFVKRFNKKAEREQIDDLSREFEEELIKTGIVDWRQITYRVCGRYTTELRLGEHFQIYELLLGDVVELILTREQEEDLYKLMSHHSDKYYFATSEEIISLGVDPGNKKYIESIGDHTKQTIQETEDKLIKISESGKRFTVDLIY